MRTLFITAFTVTTSLAAFSQDTLFTRNGKVIPARVYEINQSEIKYKKPSNPDGPLYTISKDDIAVIEYKNGSKDVFENGNVQSSSKQMDDVYANPGQSSSTQVNNNYYGSPVARPGVNVVLGMGMPYWGWSGPYYRPYYRPYYYGGWGYYRGYHHGHWRRH